MHFHNTFNSENIYYTWEFIPHSFSYKDLGIKFSDYLILEVVKAYKLLGLLATAYKFNDTYCPEVRKSLLI